MLRLDAIVYTLINLILLYAGLRHFLVKPVRETLDKRKRLLEGQFQEARDKEREALALKEQYEEILSNAKQESEEIIEKSRKTAHKEYENTLAAAEQEAGQLMERTKKNLEMEKEKSMLEMQEQVAKLAMAAAGKILSEQAGSMTNQAIYNQYAKKSGGAYDSDSN